MKEKLKKARYMGAGLVIGAGIGIILGKLAIGMALGAALIIALSLRA